MPESIPNTSSVFAATVDTLTLSWSTGRPSTARGTMKNHHHHDRVIRPHACALPRVLCECFPSVSPRACSSGVCGALCMRVRPSSGVRVRQFSSYGVSYVRGLPFLRTCGHFACICARAAHSEMFVLSCVCSLACSCMPLCAGVSPCLCPRMCLSHAVCACKHIYFQSGQAMEL